MLVISDAESIFILKVGVLFAGEVNCINMSTKM
jgi:hypothetical protein